MPTEERRFGSRLTDSSLGSDRAALTVAPRPRPDLGKLTGNRIFELLRDLHVIDPQSIVEFFPRVRDRDDMSVLCCMKSGVIFLSRSDHIDMQHYIEKDASPGLVTGTSMSRPKPPADDERRANQIRDLVRDHAWLDVGSGPGAILDLLREDVRRCAAVEPNTRFRKQASARGHRVYGSIEEVSERGFDLVTLFHVFEHLLDPMAMLSEIKQRLSPTGRLWLEVPHARDFLLVTAVCREFMGFTFWSEHLVLHTRQSLAALLHSAGYSEVVITAFQRYPLSNHLLWLARGLPGGHNLWAFLNDRELSAAYASALARLDQTDTLVAVASSSSCSSRSSRAGRV